MKIIELTISHFLSYNNITTIPFQNKFENELFLIHGKTGSGKSTIFDAITYALYGKCASERNIDEIKSKNATDNDLCYVELVFEKNNQQYKIKRIPAQVGPSNNKSKTYNTTAILTPQNITRISEINQIICEIIGYDFSQFCQIVMLPQGKIQKLLLSESKEKEIIFRTLFHTNHLLQLQEKN